MNFTKYDLGNKKRGDVVEITLQGNAANVRLMNSPSFQSYRNGRRYNYIGGLVKKSPICLTIPNSGYWYVTVDMQGLRGETRSSIRIIPSALL